MLPLRLSFERIEHFVTLQIYEMWYAVETVQVYLNKVEKYALCEFYFMLSIFNG